MGFPILVRWYLYIESGPRPFCSRNVHVCTFLCIMGLLSDVLCNLWDGSIDRVISSLNCSCHFCSLAIWRHGMNLGIYWPFVRGIHRWPEDFPHKRPVMQSFDVSFVISLNKLWLVIWDAMTNMWRHCNDTYRCAVPSPMTTSPVSTSV